MYELYQIGIIDQDALKQIEIDEKFINTITKYYKDPPEFITNISTTVEPELPSEKFLSTEIYFWGTPGSGKTTALGAILSSASSSISNVTKDPGALDYSTQLENAFKDTTEVKTLLHSTALTSFYTMNYEICDTTTSAKETQIHPITLIDMAGELMCAIYRNKSRQPQFDDAEMLSKLKKILIPDASIDKKREKNANRRIHIFLIEYGAHNKKYSGYTVTNYLEHTINYLKDNKLIEYSTDAIYVMLTKVDKVFADFESQDEQERDLNSYLNDYLNKHYAKICNTLQLICQKNSLNGGKLQFFPFSIGEICFQTLCGFDPTYADGFVKEILINKTATRAKKSFLSR